MSDYLVLFSSAFLAATVLPFYSEVVLFLMLGRGEDPLALLAVATLGNTLGSVVNWGLGRYLLHFRDRRWFYFSAEQIERAQRWYQRRGVWSLLLAWMPVGGDALTLIAGIMRVRLPLFLVLVGLGKALRYIVVIWIAGPMQDGSWSLALALQ
jgi:membrane protein YqaA with SNARE-associated domain